MSNSIPSTDLVIPILQSIRNSLERMEAGQKETNVKLDKLTDQVEKLEVGLTGTNERLDSLRVQTMQKFSDLTLKVDEGFARQGSAIDRNTAEVRELRDRFDHFLTGAGA